MVEVDVQTVSIAIASAGVFAAAIYYIFQIRHQTRIRQTDLVIRLYSAVSSKEFLEAWEKFRDREIKSRENYKEKYGFLEFNQVFAVLDEVGILLRRKLIDLDIALDLFGDAVKDVREKFKPWEGTIDDVRETRGGFGYLYNELKKKNKNSRIKYSKSSDKLFATRFVQGFIHNKYCSQMERNLRVVI